MPENTFSDRKKAVEHFSKQDSAIANFVDEDGVLTKIIKHEEDGSVMTYAFESLAQSEINGTKTSMEDVEAVIGLAKRFNYDYTPRDIRLQIAKIKQALLNSK